MRALKRQVNRFRSNNILQDLRKKGQAPNFEFSLLGPFFMCTVSSGRPSIGAIDVDVTCGMSRFSDVALVKGLVEWVERVAVKESLNLQPTKSRTSDGFAAFPTAVSLNNRRRARSNALDEAIERFTWMEWWRNAEIGFISEDVTSRVTQQMAKNSFLRLGLSIQSVLRVCPKLHQQNGQLQILVCKLEGKGYLTGGAYGSDVDQTYDRALGELMRHYLAYAQILESNLQVEDAYNLRLMHFASGYGNAAVVSRLAKNLTGCVRLPSLEIDSLIEHSCSSIVSVHRCLFANQESFVDERVDLFCL